MIDFPTSFSNNLNYSSLRRCVSDSKKPILFLLNFFFNRLAKLALLQLYWCVKK